MALEVIGASFGRTGTSSLKTSLEQLGFGPCYHMTELLGQPEHVDFWERGEPVAGEQHFARDRAGVDYPVARHCRTLSATYPDAKIILTVRDPDKWYESAKGTIYRAEPSLPQKILLGLQLPFSPRLRKLIRVFRLTGGV